MEGVLHVISLSANLITGSAFVVAGLLKLQNPALFQRALSAHGYLPRQARTVLAWCLPRAEVALGAILLAGLLPTLAGPMAAIVLLAFLAGSVAADKREGAFDCGCFGSVLGAASLRGLALRNCSLALIALLPASLGVSNPLWLHASATGVVLLAAASVFALRQSFRQAETAGNRRAFLRLAGAAIGATALGGLARSGTAEAACSYCGSCYPDTIWIGCDSPCCAAYWVRDMRNCDGICQACSNWRIEYDCSGWLCC